MQERLVVLDTETTGMEVEDGHRIVEIACVEILNRRVTQRFFHRYLDPKRDIDDGALRVHGLTREFLEDEGAPFADICAEFLDFIKDAVVVIHNAPFDLGFIDEELKNAGQAPWHLQSHCAEIVDSLELARKTPKEDGTRRLASSSLHALCKEFDIPIPADRGEHTGHRAILDARLLAEVYLRLTTRQDALTFAAEDEVTDYTLGAGLPADRPPLKVIKATPEETAAHNRKLAQIDEASEGNCIWLHQKEA